MLTAKDDIIEMIVSIPNERRGKIYCRLLENVDIDTLDINKAMFSLTMEDKMIVPRKLIELYRRDPDRVIRLVDFFKAGGLVPYEEYEENSQN